MECLIGQEQSNSFYRSILIKLNESGLPFLIGGACMLEQVAKIVRPTKDFDLHVKREDVGRMFETLETAGYHTEITFSHWLGKVFQGDTFIDVIFSSGNGVCKVDDEWFEHAVKGKVWGVPVKFCAAEEAIWSKAFVMERERYDGADIAHLLLACTEKMDWHRLLRRFGPYWRVLLSHLVLFGFIYPTKQGLIPVWVWQELWDRMRNEKYDPLLGEPVCQGTLLSRTQYLQDIEHWGYRDARLGPEGSMTAEEVEQWTEPVLEDCE
jgi:Nucleotidyl transferase of unknown function (DUF2204)